MLGAAGVAGEMLQVRRAQYRLVVCVYALHICILVKHVRHRDISMYLRSQRLWGLRSTCQTSHPHFCFARRLADESSA